MLCNTFYMYCLIYWHRGSLLPSNFHFYLHWILGKQDTINCIVLPHYIKLYDFSLRMYYEQARLCTLKIHGQLKWNEPFCTVHACCLQNCINHILYACGWLYSLLFFFSSVDVCNFCKSAVILHVDRFKRHNFFWPLYSS